MLGLYYFLPKNKGHIFSDNILSPISPLALNFAYRPYNSIIKESTTSFSDFTITNKVSSILLTKAPIFPIGISTDLIGIPAMSIGCPADPKECPIQRIGYLAMTIGLPIKTKEYPTETKACPILPIGCSAGIKGCPITPIGTPILPKEIPAMSIGSPADTKGCPTDLIGYPTRIIGTPADKTELSIINCTLSTV